MNLSLSFSPADIPAAFGSIARFIGENKILCTVLFIEYAIFYLYTYINNKSVDSDIYEIDLISAGMSSIMVAFLLIGLDESSREFSLANLSMGEPTTQIAIFLGLYALILIFFAFTKILPKFMIVILGNPELDLLINFSAILMIDPEIEFNGALLTVIAAPLLVLLAVQRLRRGK